MNKTETTWDLSDLYLNPQDPALEDTFNALLSQSQQFQNTYRNTLPHSDLSAEYLCTALDTYVSLRTTEQKPIAYAYLLYVTNTDNEEIKNLLKKTQEIRASFRQYTAFFLTEINTITEAHFHKLIQTPYLKKYVHFLLRQRAYKAHSLSELEESLLAKTEPSRTKAWQELYRELRTNMAQEELVKMEPILAHMCNAIITDKRTVDELRNFASPVSEFSLQNDIPLTVIEDVTAACLDHQEIPKQFMAIKRQVLNVNALTYSDRHKPIFESETTISIEEAKDTILSAFNAFSPEFSELANTFFENKWIDLFPRPGKISGGSTESITPDHHPYIFTNFTGKPIDVIILAHELGHGIHYLLSKKHHLLDFRVSPILAEMASTFSEMILFHHLTHQTQNKHQYGMWLARRISDSHARIFDPLHFFLLEKRIHEAARSSPNLSIKEFRTHWIETLEAVWGDAFLIQDHHADQWVHVGRLFSNPFYSFTYVFGEIITQSLYVKWLDDGTKFVDQYTALLKAGGSQSPEELLKTVGISMHDPKTWESGLCTLQKHVEQLKNVTAELNL